MNDQLVTVVSGSSKGIGAYLAQHYIQAGHLVYGLSRTAPQWQLPGYVHIIADITREADVVRAFNQIRTDRERIDNLINNAGVAAMNHALLTPVTIVEKVLDTNFIGTFLLCREAAKVMRLRKYGRIVNFVSVAVPLKLEGEAVYAASKAAVLSLTQILAREFAAFGITVNAIGPNPIETDLIRNVPREKLESLISRQAVKRFGTMVDVANVTDFFISPASEIVTGQVIYLGGV
jgi:3-oxoacyl-[acyl-carrier protein] reductase